MSQDPAVAALAMFIGSSSSNQANLSITLKPKNTGRKATADQVITRLRPKLAQIIGAQTFLQAAQDINVGGRTGQAQYQYTLSDSGLDELNTWGAQAARRAEGGAATHRHQFRPAIARPRA